MWKEYSKSYIKNNRASSISVMAAALISTLFLSFLCTLFYNFWADEVYRIKFLEGDWQGRIAGDIDESDLTVISQFANVEKAVINESLSKRETVVDITFWDARTIYQDLPQITERLGLEKDAAQYHSLLLSRYFIHDPEDEEPPLLMSFYAVLLLAVSASLILIIHNSFEISMNARIHQFGIFSSIGATPKQIRTCLLQEAAALCALPILLGGLLGIGLSYAVFRTMNLFTEHVVRQYTVEFQYHPAVFTVTFISAAATVLFSAWIPARKLSRMTPLEAIRNSGNLQMKRRKHSPLLSRMFGIEGELAGNALKAQKKALRISTISLLLSFLGFTVMLCFFTLSGISTRYTYFARYQDAWDVLATMEDTELADFSLTEEIKGIAGMESVVVYQKAEENCLIPTDWQSEELQALGGFEAVAGKDIAIEEGYISADAPIVIMDDESFMEYCSQLGAAQSLDGAVVLNRIWDSVHSEFREREYIPFVKENREVTTLMGEGKNTVEIPILSYAQEPPVLREEYGDYELVHFMPLSMWERIADQMKVPEQTTYIRILAEGEPDLGKLKALENAVEQLAGQTYDLIIENRIQNKMANDDIIDGMTLILGALCGLLAAIGIANVFSNTLGFLRQRKREFAQYLSIGLTPDQMQKMFFIEAFVIAGRPILITLPLTVAAVAFMITASHLDPMVFVREAPFLPILVFALVIIAFVGLAYYIGGKRILECDLNETLRNDTSM